jgi:iron complex transport system substrate-binding protein
MAGCHIEEFRAREAAVVNAVHDLEPVSVFVFDSYVGTTLYTTGGAAYEDCLVAAAGGANVFGDLGKTFPNISVEEIITRNPEYVIVSDYYTQDAGEGQAKIDFMKTQPEFAKVPAVINGRYLTLSGLAVFPGLQNLDALESIARFLHPDAMAQKY